MDIGAAVCAMQASRILARADHFVSNPFLLPANANSPGLLYSLANDSSMAAPAGEESYKRSFPHPPQNLRTEDLNIVDVSGSSSDEVV